MNAIRAIETRYKGYRFRSRLEARWAVFFDALDLKWEYEPEGFVTSAGPYLPDFRVWTPQGQPIWYEVKPEYVASDPKFDAFVETTMDAWVSAPEDSRVDKSPMRMSLLSGDPLSTMTAGRNTVCPRCGQIKKNRPVRGHAVIRDIGMLKAGSHLLLVYCASCFMETRRQESHETINPNLMHVAYFRGFGLFKLPYGMSNGWVSIPQCMPSRIIDAAYAARAARFEHGERG